MDEDQIRFEPEAILDWERWVIWIHAIVREERIPVAASMGVLDALGKRVDDDPEEFFGRIRPQLEALARKKIRAGLFALDHSIVIVDRDLEQAI